MSRRDQRGGPGHRGGPRHPGDGFPIGGFPAGGDDPIASPDPGDGPHPALGIDHGEARIGIAATDPLGILAHPVETIDVRTTNALERIATLAAQRGIRTLVLGLPVRIDGTEGTAAKKIRSFGKRLAKRLPDLPLVYVDEAYTTLSAAEKLREAGRKAKQQKGIIDQAAAVEILTLWLNQ